MKLIADAGSTKIEWVLLDNVGAIHLRTLTTGFNVATGHTDDLLTAIKAESPELYSCARDIDEIHYYGAGCAGDRCKLMEKILNEIFPSAACQVESDMLGAARALCGRSEGIACILGTGSNSCHYDGEKIIANVSPLGFILGDEGSGAVLGRRLIGMVMKGGFSDTVINRFNDRFPEATRDEIINRVYRCERPGAYLASFVPFLREQIDNEEVAEFVTDEFRRFFRFNVLAYKRAQSLPVSFTGSVAYHFAPQLRSAAHRCGLNIRHIEKAPMDALIAYHRDR